MLIKLIFYRLWLKSYPIILLPYASGIRLVNLYTKMPTIVSTMDVHTYVFCIYLVILVYALLTKLSQMIKKRVKVGYI